MIEELIRNYLWMHFPENSHVRAFLILVIFFMLAHIVVWISENLLLKLASKTKTNVDDFIVKRSNKPLSVIIFLFGLKFAINSYSYGVTTPVETTAEQIIYTLILLTIGFLVSGILIVLVEEWGSKFASKTKSTMDDALLPMMKRFVYIIVFIIVMMYILAYWGVDIGPILASLGVAGIAVAFALQNTLGNVFGGISMILDRSIKVGDWVKIDSAQGQVSGIIEDIGLRSTKIKTFDNEFIIVPNGNLAQSQIQNLVLPDPKCRGTITFGVSYKSDLKKVAKVAINSTKGVKHVCSKPGPSFAIDNFGDFAINCKLFFFTDSYDTRFNAKQEIMYNLFNNLKKAKIDIPYPTRTLIMKKK
jgi:MscS family membrane protein